MVSRASACESYEALNLVIPAVVFDSSGGRHFELKLEGESLPAAVFDGIAGKQFFTESLILAQDERWRRA